MSKVSRKRRQFKIKRKGKRKKKLRKLKEKYFASKSKKEKEEIIEKMKKTSPHSPIEKILGIKKEKV
ncbi:hypothetical protein KJA14_01810 [Patescibacteria group bacterium]|nr:hypothetical protein [Patescibacteria group bacterium]